MVPKLFSAIKIPAQRLYTQIFVGQLASQVVMTYVPVSEGVKLYHTSLAVGVVPEPVGIYKGLVQEVPGGQLKFTLSRVPKKLPSRRSNIKVSFT